MLVLSLGGKKSTKSSNFLVMLRPVKVESPGVRVNPVVLQGFLLALLSRCS